MPLSTDSGYLPDWLKALLGGIAPGGMPAPTGGLFSEPAASPEARVGLLSNSPMTPFPTFSQIQPTSPIVGGTPTGSGQAIWDNIGPAGAAPTFTGVRPDAPAFQGENAPPGPFIRPPMMTMPQDSGPMNIGPAGAAPSFTGINPNAPFTANGPPAVQGPASDRNFQATTAAPTNLAPPAPPNSNVQGTPASGAPEAVKSPGFGDYLGKASDLIGSIYGAGGPGDALIALGLSNRTNGASIQALNAGILNRSRQAELALKQAEANDKIKAIAGNVALVRRLYPNLSDEEISAFARNPEMMKQIGQVAAPMEQWSNPYVDDQGNLAVRHLRTNETKIIQAANESFHPATNEERAAAHMAPDDKTPLFISDKTNKPIGIPGTNVAVYNAPQSTYANQGQEAVGQQHIDLAKGVDKAQEKLMNLNAMSGALQSIREKGGTTGLGETTKVNLQSYINTLSNTVGWKPFSIDDAQMLNKFGRLMAANAAKDAQGARVTNFELDNFLKANPGLDLDPQANERLLGIMQQIEQRKIDLGTELQDRFAGGKPPTIAENHEFVKKYIAEHHIKDPITGQDITTDPRLPDKSAARSGAQVPAWRKL